MKKILILINNYHVQQHVMSFAIELAQKENCKINGLFIGNLKPGEGGRSLPGDSNAAGGHLTNESDAELEKRLEEARIKLFTDACKAANLNPYIQRIKDNFLDSIIDETAFADLALCDDDMNVPYFSMHSFLSSTYCPVVLIPGKAAFFNTIIFAYDDNTSSIHAIRQFTYLFPWSRDLKVFLISVLPENIVHMVYETLVTEWMLLHYPKAEINILKGDPKKEISDFVNAHKNSIIVMGAFGRSFLSRFFKESLAPAILERTNAPLFISHI